MPDDHQRIVLLNWLVSTSSTRSRTHQAPPEHPNRLLEILNARRIKGWAIEYFIPGNESYDTEGLRVAAGAKAGASFLRLQEITNADSGGFRYVTLLIKHANATIKAFSVEDLLTYEGREIEGNETERGVIAAHVTFRLPRGESQLDIGRYRCVVEVVPTISRSRIEHFLCRQLRRTTDVEEWSFSVNEHKGRKSQPVPKNIRYTPRLELSADVGRALNTSTTDPAELAYMLFTKRSERQTIGRPTEVRQEDVYATVDIKISASQGPTDPEEKIGWTQVIRNFYTGRGFKERLYYRHQSGDMTGGEVHPAMEGAADLLMCPKAFVPMSAVPVPSEPTANVELVRGMRVILDRDELWEHSQ